jgi:hypothetical protein
MILGSGVGRNMSEMTTDIETNGYAAELKHLDESYQAQMAAYKESDPQKQVILDELGPKIERAKEHFYLMGTTGEEAAAEDNHHLMELLDDVRDAFKRMERKSNNGGPPLA